MYLVARVSTVTVEALAAFDVEAAELSPDGSDEPTTGSQYDECELDHDDHDCELE